MILGLETSCDETCAALVDDDGTVVANVVASQSAFHERYGGVVPEIASRRHLELVGPVVRAALDDGGLALATSTASRSPPARASSARCSSASRRPRPRLRGGRPLVPVDHLHGHVASLFLAPDAVEPPLLVLLASGGHTLLLRVERHDRYAVLGRSLDDAAGEALDKGARLLGLGYPGGPAIERLARDGDPEASPSRSRGPRGARLQLLGAEDGAAVHRVRLARRSSRSTAPTSRRPTSAPSCGRSSSAPWRRRSHDRPAIGVVGGVAANCELRASLPEAAGAPLAVHGQRRHDRLGRPLRRPLPVPGLPFPRCVRLVGLTRRSSPSSSSSRSPPPRWRSAWATCARPTRRPSFSRTRCRRARGRGLVGGPKVHASVGQRVLVQLRVPSLARRIERAGGQASGGPAVCTSKVAIMTFK